MPAKTAESPGQAELGQTASPKNITDSSMTISGAA